MRLELDLQHLRSCMVLSRDAVAVRPGANSMKATQERARLLSRAAAVLPGWLDMLSACNCEDPQLQQVVSEIHAFQAWADEAASALRLIDGALRSPATR